MRRASLAVDRLAKTLGTAALIVGVVACGGGGGAGGAQPASAVGPSGEKLTSKPPTAVATTTGAADKSPKTVCAGAKPVSMAEPQESRDSGASRPLFASGKDRDRELVTGSQKAKDREYSMADLKALEAKKEWRELIMHMDDVSPAKRDAQWDALLDKAAPEFMAQTVKEKDPFEGFYLAMHLVDKYPKLAKNKAFMDKRLEVAKPALKECFSQSYRGGRCLKAAQEFASTGDADSAFAIGKVVRLGQNHHVAIPFFEKGLEGRKAGAAECGDEDLKLSVVSALALPPDYDNAKVGRKVAGGVCFDKLKPAIEAEFKDGSSSYAENACSVLKAKNAL